MTDHSIYRGWSASYVLGALDSAERIQFENHLSQCEECRREVAEFAPIPGLLAKLDGYESDPAPASVASMATDQVRSEWAALERSRKRWRWLAAAAAAVAVVAMVASAVPTFREETVWIVESSVSATGTIELESRAWGTAVHLDLADLPDREGYIAWVIDSSGNKQQIAVWGPTNGGVAVLDSTSSVKLDDVSVVAVTGLDGQEALLTATG